MNRLPINIILTAMLTFLGLTLLSGVGCGIGIDSCFPNAIAVSMVLLIVSLFAFFILIIWT